MKELLETRLRYICRIIEENTQYAQTCNLQLVAAYNQACNDEKEEVERLLKVVYVN
jgi:hypothetical protein